MTEIQKFERWLEKEIEKGLVYFNVFFNPTIDRNDITYESFCKEFNDMKAASDVEDKDILGARSL